MIFVSVQASLITNVSDLHLGKHFYTLFCSVELSVFTVTDFTGTLFHTPLYMSVRVKGYTHLSLFIRIWQIPVISLHQY